MSKPLDSIKRRTYDLCNYCTVAIVGLWCCHPENADKTGHDTACTNKDWNACELKDE